MVQEFDCEHLCDVRVVRFWSHIIRKQNVQKPWQIKWPLLSVLALAVC